MGNAALIPESHSYNASTTMRDSTLRVSGFVTTASNPLEDFNPVFGVARRTRPSGR
jgi:hypothetical protein